MKRPLAPRHWIAFALSAALFAPGTAAAEANAAPALLAQGAPDCFAIGQQVAAQNGGTLARASAENQGGQTVCRIVVLVPGGDGGRTKRAEFVVPAR